MHKGGKWDRNNFDVNNIFVFQMALDIIQMMMIQSHKIQMNVDKEMIGLNGERQCKQNYIH